MATLSKIKASDNVTYNIRDDYSTWGGRNILLQSKGEFTGTIPSSSYSDFKTWNNVIIVNPNEIWTASFDAKSSTAGSKMNTYFYKNTSGIVQVSSVINSQGITGTGSDGGNTIILTANYVRYWVTWTFNNGTAALKTFIAGRALSGTNNGSTITIKNVKLEKGSKPTDWSPAPEDIARFIGNETIELYG